MSTGGIAGPILFTLVVMICASLRPGYDHISYFISELGATGTSKAALMNFAGFLPTGILITVFGISLIKFFPKRFLVRTGSVLIIIFGLGITAAGFFSCDPGCPRNGSLENNIHDRLSGLIFLGTATSILLMGIAFRSLPLWRMYWVYSVISSFFAYIFLAALINSLDSYTYTGLWQRLLLLTIFLWTIVIARNIYKSLANGKMIPGSERTSSLAT